MKINLRPRLLCWWWDVKNVIGRAYDWFDEFIEPKFSDTEGYVPYPDASKHLFYLRLSNDGVTPINIFSIPTDLQYKRSPILPWKKYAYVKLSQPKSSYSILYACSGFIGPDNQELSAMRCCEIYCDTVNRSFITTEPWWTPSSGTRGVVSG